ETGESIDMQAPIHDRVGELERANYVGVAYTGRSDSPIGTEFDLDSERVVSVRVEGLLRGDHYGHVDPDGEDGVPFDDDTGLVADLQDALQAEREWPDVPRSGVTYTHLLLQDYGPRNHEYADYYRHDWDMIFDGFEELP
ncbi:MAG: hypothetical protein RI560_13250, partial [Natronomonas sp.]|nr:hypothetical protein [Natronomonas sp.]